MATRIQKRRDTATNWSVNNPILHLGEEGFETDTKKTKTGDGTTAWNSLAYDVSIDDIAPQPLTVVLDTGNVASKEIDMDGFAIQNVANPVYASDAANKSYVDNKVVNLRKLLGPIDCSANPDYPAGNVGDTYEVTAPGKIGGAGGLDVELWDEIVCSTANAGGDQESAGAYWYIVQGDVLGATQTVSGTIRIATGEEVDAGESEEIAVTPKTLTAWLSSVISSLFQPRNQKDETDGYAGLSGFSVVFKNATGLIKSYLGNSNTVSRTYGFPDKNGTVAMTDDITSAVAAEASTRASADTALSSSIASEASTRASADSSEASTRASADSALSTSIASEASTRASADSSEASTRAAADAAILALHIDVKTTSDTTTSGTSFFDVAGLALPIEAGEKIKFDGYIPVECSAANGARITLTVPAGSTFRFTSTGNGSSTTYVSSNIDLGATTESGSMCTLATNQNHIRFIGWIEAGATAGNLQIRIRSGNAANVVKALAGAIISGKKYT